MTDFEVGDDTGCMLRLAADKKLKTGQSLKAPNVDAG